MPGPELLRGFFKLTWSGSLALRACLVSWYHVIAKEMLSNTQCAETPQQCHHDKCMLVELLPCMASNLHEPTSCSTPRMPVTCIASLTTVALPDVACAYQVMDWHNAPAQQDKRAARHAGRKIRKQKAEHAHWVRAEAKRAQQAEKAAKQAQLQQERAEQHARLQQERWDDALIAATLSPDVHVCRLDECTRSATLLPGTTCGPFA